MSIDLWPEVDFDVTVDTETPAGLLQSQAEVLRHKTKNVLKGELSVYSERNVIYNTFYIVAPRLDHYRYALMRVISGPTLYPAYVFDYSIPDPGNSVLGRALLSGNVGVEVCLPGVNGEEVGRADFVVHDYTELENVVREILSSKETANILRSLMSQSKALSTAS